MSASSRRSTSQVDRIAPIILSIYSSGKLISGTYKLKKNVLQKDGFDPALTKGDPVFFLDLKADKYVPLTAELYESIVSGKLRL